jgi:hypothetical protein
MFKLPLVVSKKKEKNNRLIKMYLVTYLELTWVVYTKLYTIGGHPSFSVVIPRIRWSSLVFGGHPSYSEVIPRIRRSFLVFGGHPSYSVVILRIRWSSRIFVRFKILIVASFLRVCWCAALEFHSPADSPGDIGIDRVTGLLMCSSSSIAQQTHLGTDERTGWQVCWCAAL